MFKICISKQNFIGAEFKARWPICSVGNAVTVVWAFVCLNALQQTVKVTPCFVPHTSRDRGLIPVTLTG